MLVIFLERLRKLQPDFPPGFNKSGLLKSVRFTPLFHLLHLVKWVLTISLGLYLVQEHDPVQ